MYNIDLTIVKTFKNDFSGIALFLFFNLKKKKKCYFI